ncbi:hypothetical protein C7B82_19740 [Stenomitos frigidus ULC18]|uniref:Filamentous haemagglutinin FhaB/tRNA nuclease CdiA-like TPS domain-containing protein n=1 Tax=Stenomitos frigidus ULC18 TaxID=2107698 RepID=A0A2T1E164_9CYAN|nr:hypothetical protein C7B82_19740 [Stenomitos frigidus ULC18]
MLGILGTSNRALAQVTADTTLPMGERSQVSAGPLFQINGGAVRDRNLFHSFEQFSLAQGETAFFNNTANITNIISRVTGGLPSSINGVLQANGSANLFLINPNGVLFGPNASLNLGGTFLATTASAIQFGNQGLYSATDPTVPPLLTVNPSALLFNQLVNQPIATQARLQVTTGKSLALVGGSVLLNRGALLSQGGRVELGGLAGKGIVELDGSGSNLHLTFGATDRSLADVTLINQSEVNVRTGGSIGINAQNFRMADRSILRGGIALGEGASGSKAGDIDLYASGAVSLTEGSFIANSTLGLGDGGNVDITAGSVLLKDGSQVGANTRGVGNSGTVTIRSSGSVTLDGETRRGVSGGLYSEVEAGATGNSSGIKIIADSVSVTNGAVLSARTLENGNAGNIEINAHGAVRFEGVGPVDQFASGAYAGVGAQPFGKSNGKPGFGNSGDLMITAGSLTIANSALLDASASPLSRGNAGKIQLRIAGAVNLEGSSNRLVDPGGIYSYIGSDGDKLAVGNSGGITLVAQSLSLKNGAALVASTFGQGNAGDISLDVTGAVTLDGQGSLSSTGIFSSVTRPAKGDSGQIMLSVGSLSVTNGAAIASSVLGRGRAANIAITAMGDVTFDGISPFASLASFPFPSGIFSRVGPNALGTSDINVTARSLTLTNGAQFQANTLGATTAGSLQINTTNDIRIVGNNATTGSSGLFSTTIARGSGGDINVNGRSLFLQDGAVISSQSRGVGSAGSIDIRLRNRLQANDSKILTNSTQSAGGNITIAARAIALRGDSDITTSVLSGTGGGGNITLGARAIVALDDSDILAFSRDGSGGNITLNTPAFFGFRYRSSAVGVNVATLDGNGQVDVNASGKLRSGTIILPNVTLQSNLVPLPIEVIDTSKLIARSCIARNPRQGSFLVIGAGGLPNQPDDLATAPFPTYVITPDETVKREPVELSTDLATAPFPTYVITPDETVKHESVELNLGTQKRDLVENGSKDVLVPSEAGLVEIDGIYQLANGAVVLGRSCHPF